MQGAVLGQQPSALQTYQGKSYNLTKAVTQVKWLPEPVWRTRKGMWCRGMGRQTWGGSMKGPSHHKSSWSQVSLWPHLPTPHPEQSCCLSPLKLQQKRKKTHPDKDSPLQIVKCLCNRSEGSSALCALIEIPVNSSLCLLTSTFILGQKLCFHCLSNITDATERHTTSILWNISQTPTPTQTFSSCLHFRSSCLHYKKATWLGVSMLSREGWGTPH